MNRNKPAQEWKRLPILALVCALVIGVYAWTAHSCALESAAGGPQNSDYNLLVQGFLDGQLNVKREAPPELVHPGAGPTRGWLQFHWAYDLSYYKGKLYLYFGVTPVLLLFWPYAALTGHYLWQMDAVVIFFSAGFLAGVGLLRAIWRRYFHETGFGTLVAGTLALGLANFAPAILGRCDIYEVAVSCGYALTMLALAAVWGALQDARHRWRWLAAASLAYGLALGARPSLLLGAVILLVPVGQAWREKRRVWPLLLAAGGPIVFIGLGLMGYNALRFDNPLEFGQRYQLPLSVHRQFSLSYFWFNFRVGFLDPAHWSAHFPFVHDIARPAQPGGYFSADHPFGILTNIPLVWLALAAPLAWRNRPAEERSRLRWFLGAAALLFGMCALTISLHDSMCLRYEVEFAAWLVWLAVIGLLALERALAGQPAWRRAARCGCGLLLASSVGFNLLAAFEMLAEANYTVGRDLLLTGRVEEGKAHLQKALDLEPDDMDLHSRLGSDLVQADLLDEAITQYQEGLRLKPHNMEACYNLGVILVRRGRMDEAITQFQTALQIWPDYAEAHSGLGYALMQKGRLDEALNEYQQSLKLKPGYAEVHWNIAYVLVKKGRLGDAIAQYQQSLQLQPDNAEVRWNFAATLLQRGRLDEAIDQYQAGLQLQPDKAEAHYGLGYALMKKGRLDDAITQYQQSLQLGPDTAETRMALGAALLQKGRLDEAILQYQQALRLKPDRMEIQAGLGSALLQKGRFDEAIAHFQRALQLKPADPENQNNLAWVLATCPDASLRDGGKAVELARQANGLTGGENPAMLHTLAAACAEAGRFAEAVETAQRALRLAGAQSSTELAGRLQSELKLYQAGTPFHSPAQPH